MVMFVALIQSTAAFRPQVAAVARSYHSTVKMMASKPIAQPLKVGLVGGGIVGGGVYQLVQKSAARLTEVGAGIDIAKICVRDINKKRDYTVSESTKFVSNIDDILNDPSINCVVELMGGTTTAKVDHSQHLFHSQKYLLPLFHYLHTLPVLPTLPPKLDTTHFFTPPYLAHYPLSTFIRTWFSEPSLPALITT